MGAVKRKLEGEGCDCEDFMCASCRGLRESVALMRMQRDNALVMLRDQIAIANGLRAELDGISKLYRERSRLELGGEGG